MEGVRMILLCSFFIILHSCYHCLAQPPFTIPQGSLAVLPAGFSRAQNEPFTSTKLPFSELSSSSGQILQNASQTPFIAFDAHFASILGNNPTIRTLAERDFAFAVGGARYLQPSNEVTHQCSFASLLSCPVHVPGPLTDVPDKTISCITFRIVTNGSQQAMRNCSPFR